MDCIYSQEVSVCLKWWQHNFNAPSLYPSSLSLSIHPLSLSLYPSSLSLHPSSLSLSLHPSIHPSIPPSLLSLPIPPPLSLSIHPLSLSPSIPPSLSPSHPLGHDGSLRFWSMESKICIQEITAHRKHFDESICNVACHLTKPYFASCGADSVAKVFV